MDSMYAVAFDPVNDDLVTAYPFNKRCSAGCANSLVCSLSIVQAESRFFQTNVGFTRLKTSLLMTDQVWQSLLTKLRVFSATGATCCLVVLQRALNVGSGSIHPDVSVSQD